MIGEFCASTRNPGYPELTGTELTRHLASRTYFNKKMVDACTLNGIKPYYWDAYVGKDGSGLFDRITAAVVDQPSITALTGGAALPPP
jgi:hypothetical protein